MIRREGAGFVHCVKAVVEADGLSLGDAKTLVHQSPAWADESEAREAFWDDVQRALKAQQQNGV